MKKIILSALVIASLVACGGSEEKKTGETKETTTTDDLSSNPDYKKGLALVGGSDCFTCHKIDEAFVGPTYKEVAKKYAGAPDTMVTHLANQIIKGSTGVWGSSAMTPHATVSQGDAEAMVKYILLLK